MSSTLVTTEAGSAAAGSEGVSEGATGNPRQGQANPVPLPANPLPESLQYVTVYNNDTQGRLRRIRAGVTAPRTSAAPSTSPPAPAITRSGAVPRSVREIEAMTGVDAAADLATRRGWTRAPTWRRALACASLALCDPAAARRRSSCRRPRSTGRARTSSASAGSAMAEDGTGGLVYLKRVEGVTHVFVSRYAGRPLAGADPGRRRRAVRRQLAADRRRRRRRADRRVGDAVRDRTRQTGLRADGRGARARRREHFGQADPDRPQHRRSDRHQPRPRGQLHRPGGCRLPRGEPRRQRGNHRCCAPATWSSRCASPTSTASAGRASARSTATPASSMRPPTEANAPKIAIGPTGNGVVVWQEPEIARRGAHLGTAAVRQPARLRDAGQREQAQRAAKSSRTPTLRASRSPSSARPIVAYRQQAGPGLAAARPAHLPEHRSRTAKRRAAPSSSAPSSRRHGSTRAAAQPSSGPPSIDIDERRETRLLYDANGTPRVIGGNDQGSSTSGSRSGPASPAPNRLRSA